jgi:hypothetical protein
MIFLLWQTIGDAFARANKLQGRFERIYKSGRTNKLDLDEKFKTGLK